MAGYRHIVLFRLHAGTSARERDEAVQRLRSLGDLPGIEEWRVERSIDDRKGEVLAQVGLFRSLDAFEAFRQSSEHRSAGELMSGLTDWLVADYHE